MGQWLIEHSLTYRGHGFDYWHPHGGLQLSVTSIQTDPCLLLACFWHQAYTEYVGIYVDKTPIYAKERTKREIKIKREVDLHSLKLCFEF